MKAILIVSLLAIIPTLSHAGFPESMKCVGDAGATVAYLEHLLEYPVIDQDYFSVRATLKIEKFKGALVNASFGLSGEKWNSAGGPYYELTFAPVGKFFLSGAASQSPSELTYNGVMAEVSCE
jgi:hypothetical protein